jgi:hypothetical protein
VRCAGQALAAFEGGIRKMVVLEIGMVKLALEKIGQDKSGVPQVSSSKLDFPELALPELGIQENGMLKIYPEEDPLPEYAVSEVGVAEIKILERVPHKHPVGRSIQAWLGRATKIGLNKDKAVTAKIRANVWVFSAPLVPFFRTFKILGKVVGVGHRLGQRMLRYNRWSKKQRDIKWLYFKL